MTTVDAFFSNATQWKDEMLQLRRIALSCGLTEGLKYGLPCYMYEKKNVVLIQGFKAYCAFLFFKGYLVKDEGGILQKTGEHTRVGRQARYTNKKDLVKQEAALKALIYQAIEVEKAGVKTTPPKKADVTIPDELQQKFKENAALKKAFNALTPGRQKGYLIYFSSAKQSQTRIARIEKCIKQILRGEGLNGR